MNISYKFHNISDVLKDDLKHYSSTKFEHLERFLSTFPEDNKMLTVAIEHHEKGNLYDVKCTLQAGGKTIHHDESTHDPKEAIDKSESNLVRQIKKHMELMRGE